MSYREDMRAMVMPRWSCGYTVVLTSLRESFMGERGEKNGEEQERETEKIQYQENITANCFHFYAKARMVPCQTSPLKEKRINHLMD